MSEPVTLWDVCFLTVLRELRARSPQADPETLARSAAREAELLIDARNAALRCVRADRTDEENY